MNELVETLLFNPVLLVNARFGLSSQGAESVAFSPVHYIMVRWPIKLTDSIKSTISDNFH